jgi:hypothetical protein
MNISTPLLYKSTQLLPKFYLTHRNVVLSAVHRGVAFEERSLKLLQDNLSMTLKRVGGKSDGGIDLMGWWWLPPAVTVNLAGTNVAVAGESSSSSSQIGRRRIRVLAQCKAEKKKMGPHYVREMEGVLHRYIARNQELLQSPVGPLKPEETKHTGHYPLVALLISQSHFTPSTILRAQSSPVPFLLLHIPPLPSPEEEGPEETGIGMAIWNPALGGDKGLLGGQIEVRWERSVSGGGANAGRPALWWEGRRLGSWTPDGGDGDEEMSGLDGLEDETSVKGVEA